MDEDLQAAAHGSDSALNSSFNSALSGFESLLRKQMGDESEPKDSSGGERRARNAREGITQSHHHNAVRVKLKGTTLNNQFNATELHRPNSRHGNGESERWDPNKPKEQHRRYNTFPMHRQIHTDVLDQRDHCEYAFDGLSREKGDKEDWHSLNRSHEGASVRRTAQNQDNAVRQQDRSYSDRARSLERGSRDRHLFHSGGPRNNSANNLDELKSELQPKRTQLRGRSASPVSYGRLGAADPGDPNSQKARLMDLDAQQSRDLEGEHDARLSSSAGGVGMRLGSSGERDRSTNSYASPDFQPQMRSALVTPRTTPMSVSAKHSTKRSLFFSNGIVQNGHREVNILFFRSINTVL